jgi:transcriptional regulator with XRE-family HTH domain
MSLLLIHGEKRNRTPHDELLHDLRIKERWGAFLANARTRSGLSHEELDQKLDLVPGTYAAWENGFRLPQAKMLSRILAHFDFDTNLEFQDLYTRISQEARDYRERHEIG